MLREAVSWAPQIWRNQLSIWCTVKNNWLADFGEILQQTAQRASWMRVSEPVCTLCLSCTINSELNYFLIHHQFMCSGVNIRWFPVNGFDTRWIPRNFSCVYEGVEKGSSRVPKIRISSFLFLNKQLSIWRRVASCVFRLQKKKSAYSYIFIDFFWLSSFLLWISSHLNTQLSISE